VKKNSVRPVSFLTKNPLRVSAKRVKDRWRIAIPLVRNIRRRKMKSVKPCPKCGKEKHCVLERDSFVRVYCWACSYNGPKRRTTIAAIAAWNEEFGKEEKGAKNIE
jgi:predicted RNA-binding Zn-ribbon protein involved in translation (DUF1610 family)